MTTDILYSIANTPSGQMVDANDAEKGIDYNCPSCKQPFILRKGKKKRPHFAHKNLRLNCTPETALHYSFKNLLCHKIQKHIDRKQSLEIRWKCSKCFEYHSGDLLKKAVRVETEYDLGICRPDIALLGENGKAVAVIEVIVSHAPEQTVVEFYQKNKIAVVSYYLNSDKDIHRLNSSNLKPCQVSLCTNPKCSKCRSLMLKKRLLVIDDNCKKCSAPMKVATLDKVEAYHDWGSFSPSDIPLAAKHGCHLTYDYGYMTERQHIANTCRNCGTFIGSHYLFTEYVAVPESKREEYDIGFYCPKCSK